MFTVANRAASALCPPSALADNIAVCEYMEQCNRTVYTPQDDVMNTDRTLFSNVSRTSTTVIMQK